ncbi:MAG: hemolysin family protein, partial [Desulfovibrio sp.]|uniref:hemolysin family protein n=1 Tax=Desulfovibrio sp. TaxID=885 RepID=UPI0039E5FE6B
VPHDMPLAEVAHIIVRSGHSRIPVYKETRDNIVGILHAKDLLSSMLDAGGKPTSMTELIREPFFVPETKSIRTLLQEFRARKQHIAIALDEYGGTSGLITIEDVLEEIVGDIEDEHDAPRQEDIRPLGDNIYELTGRALLEDLEDMGVDVDSDEVDTIGGYLSMEAGHVPGPGESFTLRGWTFTVLEADRKLIVRLRMEPASNAANRSSADQVSESLMAADAHEMQPYASDRETAAAGDKKDLTEQKSLPADVRTEDEATRPAESTAKA